MTRQKTRNELERENRALRNQMSKLMRVLREERQMLMRHGPDKAFDAFQKILGDTMKDVDARYIS